MSVEKAWGRAIARMDAGAQTAEPAGGEAVALEADDAAHLFAGMDLPAREVLWALDEKVIGVTLRAAEGRLDMRALHGMVLAAFLFGWEARS